MQTPPSFDRLAYTVSEACAALGIGRTSLYKLIAERKLQTVRIAGRRLIPVAAARALLESASAWDAP